MSSPQRSLFRAALARGAGLVLGTWVKLPAMESVELLALAGFDFVVVDLEHSPLNLETASQLVATARLSGMAPLVRVPGLHGGLVQRVLDAGAEGLVVPHVDTVEDARRAVDAVRFPPVGSRGVGSTGRAGAWGARDRSEYLRFGQEEVVLVAQIESLEATRQAAQVASVPGVDALLVGEADLSVSAGVGCGQAELDAAVTRTVAAGRDAGKPVGNAGDGSPAAVARAAAHRLAFTLLSNDASLLGRAARQAVTAARRPGTGGP